MTSRRQIALLAFVPLLALAACGKDKPKESAASGEILPGSVSDAMIPEDRLTSQPPLAPVSAHSGKAAAVGTGGATDAASPDAAAAPPPAKAEPDSPAQ